MDVGQVLFGDTTSMTADGAVGQFLHSVTGRKWLSQDVEMETGCGVVPIAYENKNFVHALQWAIGLERYLRRGRPVAGGDEHRPPERRLVPGLPADHRPADGSGPSHADMLASLPDRVRARSGLGDLTREYTLSEIAIITRAGPGGCSASRIRATWDRSADGDVAIYTPDDDKERMFSLPPLPDQTGRSGSR